MIAPMNDWMLSVVPVSQQRRAATPHSTAGDGEHDGQRQPERLEVRRQQQEDDRDRQQQADPQAEHGLLERRDLAAHGDGHAARRLAGAARWRPAPRSEHRPRVVPWMLAVRLTTRCML